MALLRVISDDGTPILIHTSQLFPPRPPQPEGSTWAEVWKRADTPREEPTLKEPDQ